MRIITWNMNGCSARVKDGSLQALLRRQPDILCLQETKLGSKPLPGVVGGYHASWCCAEGGGHHGVAVLGKDAPISVRTSGVADIDCEGRVLAVELSALWAVSAYSPTFLNRPDREPYRHRFDAVLLSFIGSLLATGKPVVVCGDLNVTATDIDCHQAPLYAGTPNHTAAEREAFASIIALGLTDCWRGLHPAEREYSWMPVANTPLGRRRLSNSGFRFDYILASYGASAISSDILVSHPGSDHVPVVADVRFVER